MSTLFQEMVDTVLNKGLVNEKYDSPANIENYKREFFGMVTRNNIFLFNSSDVINKNFKSKTSLSEYTFSSPFDIISMEMSDPNRPLLSSNDGRINRIFQIYCLMYNDIKDVVYLYGKIPTTGDGVVFRIGLGDLTCGEEMYLIAKGLIEKCVDKINSEKVAVEQVRRGITIKSMGGKKKYHEISKVIHISNTKKYFRELSTDTNRKIEFSHRFFKRGHWRFHSPETIGKDRHGERNQRGRTWVTEHIVGNEDLPLIHKMRVVAGNI